MIVVGQPCRAHAAEWDGEGALSTEAAEPAGERDMEAEEGGFFCESGIGLFSMEGIAGSGVRADDDLLLYGDAVRLEDGGIRLTEPGFVGRDSYGVELDFGRNAKYLLLDTLMATRYYKKHLLAGGVHNVA